MSSQKTDSLKRSVAELRQAAIDSGFANDPLTDEILNTMADLEASRVVLASENAKVQAENARLAAHAQKPPSRARMAMLWVTGACVGLAVAGITVGGVMAQKLRTAEENVVKKDGELSALRATTTQQVVDLTKRLDDTLAEASRLAKTNATAANINEIAARMYLNKFQDLLEEYARLKQSVGETNAKPEPKNP